MKIKKPIAKVKDGERTLVYKGSTVSVAPSKKCSHSWTYFGGECRCTKCYAELLPGGKTIPWKRKGKPAFIKFIEGKNSKNVYSNGRRKKSKN